MLANNGTVAKRLTVADIFEKQKLAFENSGEIPYTLSNWETKIAKYFWDARSRVESQTRCLACDHNNLHNAPMIGEGYVGCTHEYCDCASGFVACLVEQSKDARREQLAWVADAMHSDSQFAFEMVCRDALELIDELGSPVTKSDAQMYRERAELLQVLLFRADPSQRYEWVGQQLDASIKKIDTMPDWTKRHPTGRIR